MKHAFTVVVMSLMTKPQVVARLGAGCRRWDDRDRGERAGQQVRGLHV